MKRWKILVTLFILSLLTIERGYAKTSPTGFIYPVESDYIPVASGGYVGWLDENIYNTPPCHLAVDFKIDTVGTAVYAIADGDVVAKDDTYSNTYDWGGVLVIKHRDSTSSYFTATYGHIIISKDIGNQVKAGQQIGTITNCWVGGSNYPHLHFSIHPGENVVWTAYTAKPKEAGKTCKDATELYGFVHPINFLNTIIPDNFLSIIPPKVTTNIAYSVTSTSTTLNATVNPNGATTTVWFEWGTSSAFGNTTPVQTIDGTNDVSLSTTLSGLTPGTTYYYRVRASNSQGDVAGDIFSFITPLPSPFFVTATKGYAYLPPHNFVTVTIHKDYSGTCYYQVYRSLRPDPNFAVSISPKEEPWMLMTNSHVEYYDDDEKEVIPGQVYYYYVRLAKDKEGTAMSAYSSAKYDLSTDEYANAVYVTPPIVAVNASDGMYTNKVRITWNSVPGAKYYRVYTHTTTQGLCYGYPSSCSTFDVFTPLGNWQQGTLFDDYKATANMTYQYVIRYITSANIPGQGTGILFGEDIGYWGDGNWVENGFRYVATDGNDNNNNCANNRVPCKTIQHAIDAAKNGDTVMVDEGRYIETITLKAGVKVLGKGAGKSIIDANKDAYDIGTGKGMGSVITAIGTDITNAVVLSGFTLTGGSGRNQDSFNGGGIYIANGAAPIISGNTITDNVSGTFSEIGHGGAIYVMNASPVIENNIISNNSCGMNASPKGNGCGIYVKDSDSITIRHNTIQANNGTGAGGNKSSGGGMYIVNTQNAMIANNTITENDVWIDGGGLAVISCLNCSVVNNTITGNKVHYGNGGGILVSQSPNLVIMDNSITNNEIGYMGNRIGEGGGIYLANSENVTIKRNTITGNGGSGKLGGGIFISQSKFMFLNNIVSNNHTEDSGGGIYVIDSHNASVTNNLINRNGSQSGGGVALYDSMNILITNNVINNNGSMYGGGILGSQSYLIIANNTITKNQANASNWGNGFGGGIYNSGGDISIYNNIITENSADGTETYSMGGGIYNEGGTMTGDYNNIWGNTACRYCSPNRPHYPDSNVLFGSHGISVNPLFVDADGGDYHLQMGSPCIGMGTFTNLPNTDFEGNPRPNPVGSQPDMGAYEYSNGDTIITNATGGIVVLPANAALVSFPSNAVSENVAVTITKIDQSEIPPVNGGFRIVDEVYEFTSMTTASTSVTNFFTDIQISLRYDPTNLGGLDEQNLKIHYYDELQGQWVALASTVDPETHTVTATTNHFTKFAILAQLPSEPTPIPTVIPVDPTPIITPAVPEPTTIIMLGVGLLILIGVVSKRQRRK